MSQVERGKKEGKKGGVRDSSVAASGTDSENGRLQCSESIKLLLQQTPCFFLIVCAVPPLQHVGSRTLEINPEASDFGRGKDGSPLCHGEWSGTEAGMVNTGNHEGTLTLFRRVVSTEH